MDKVIKTETHGCIVCGKLSQILVVYDLQGKFIDAKVLAAGFNLVEHPSRPLMACEHHPAERVAQAVQKAYGGDDEDGDL